jgi:hypothetical protein
MLPVSLVDALWQLIDGMEVHPVQCNLLDDLVEGTFGDAGSSVSPPTWAKVAVGLEDEPAVDAGYVRSLRVWE